MVAVDAARFVVVLTTAALTTMVTALEVEEATLEVPEYTAVIESDPTGRLELDIEATPPDRVAVPMVVDPL